MVGCECCSIVLRSSAGNSGLEGILFCGCCWCWNVYVMGGGVFELWRRVGLWLSGAGDGGDGVGFWEWGCLWNMGMVYLAGSGEVGVV